MALSKKDCIELARILRVNKPSQENYVQLKLWENITTDLAYFLKKNNIRFDYMEFYDACNMKFYDACNGE